MKLLRQLLEMAHKLDQEMSVERAIALLTKRRDTLVSKRHSLNLNTTFMNLMPTTTTTLSGEPCLLMFEIG